MSTILVTGASGFIGAQLCERLVSEGHVVHGVSRRQRSSRVSGMQWWRSDLSSSGAVGEVLRRVRPEIVFHLASRVTGSRDLSEVVPIFQANLASTVHVLVGAVEAGCERVVLAGSCEAPGSGNGPALGSPYAAAKWCSAGYAGMFRDLFRVPVVVPRIFMTYGPGQQDTRKIIPYTIISMLRGERPKLSSGQRLVDWIYIDDVIEGLMRAAFTAGMEETTFDLGSGLRVSIRDVVEQVAEIVGNGVVPDFGALPDRPLEHERVADTRVLERMFCWKPSISLREGLRKTVRWFKSARDMAPYAASVFWTLANLWSELFTCPESTCLAQ